MGSPRNAEVEEYIKEFHCVELTDGADCRLCPFCLIRQSNETCISGHIYWFINRETNMFTSPDYIWRTKNLKGQDVLFSSKSDSWETPRELFDMLSSHYKFTLDPCATPENAKCTKYYTEAENGLEKSWAGERVFVNPPYSNVAAWVKKGETEGKNALVVMLLPARTDTRWFHEYVYRKCAAIFFIRGRLKFVGSSNSAPFPSMLVLFDHGNTSTEIHTLDAKTLKFS